MSSDLTFSPPGCTTISFALVGEGVALPSHGDDWCKSSLHLHWCKWRPSRTFWKGNKHYGGLIFFNLFIFNAFIFFFLLFFIFWPHCRACIILIPKPKIKPMIPAAEAQSPNHWITREFLNIQPFGGKEAGTCRILVPQQGVKPAPPALEAWSLNPLTPGPPETSLKHLWFLKNHSISGSLVKSLV